MPKLASAVTHQYVLKHQSSLVVAYASACASEVFRIFAPEQPYEKEETLRAVYENFNQTLGWLKYASSSSKRKRRSAYTFVGKMSLVLGDFVSCLFRVLRQTLKHFAFGREIIFWKDTHNTTKH